MVRRRPIPALVHKAREGYIRRWPRASRPLSAAGHTWIDTFDINPLVFDGERFVAVDGLCLLRDA